MQETTDRRGFFKVIIRGSAFIIGAVTLIPGIGMLLAPVVSRAQRGRKKVIYDNPEDANATGFVPARYEGQAEAAPGIFVKKQAGSEPVVLSAKCTHAGCPVTWKDKDNKFFCRCHGGYFDATGKNISGPPPKPLERLNAQIVNGEIFVEEPQA
jgi:Rieske Fe-S protein